MITIINKDIIGDYSNIKHLRKKISKWLVSSFTGVGIINKETKFLIEFNSTSFRKLVSGRVGEVKLLSLLGIKDLIKNGNLISVDVDDRKRKEIIAVYKFKAFVSVDSNTYPFYFTVRQLSTGRFVYSGHVNIKKTLS